MKKTTAKKISYQQGDPTPKVTYGASTQPTPQPAQAAQVPDNSKLAKSFRDWRRIGQGITVSGK